MKKLLVPWISWSDLLKELKVFCHLSTHFRWCSLNLNRDNDLQNSNPNSTTQNGIYLIPNSYNKPNRFLFVLISPNNSPFSLILTIFINGGLFFCTISIWYITLLCHAFPWHLSGGEWIIHQDNFNILLLIC